MRISTRGRYALRLMIDVAVHGGQGYVSLKDVAERQQISVKYLEQIVGILCKAGLLQSSRGPQGGYCLNKPAGEYPVGSILRLTEGNLAPVSCLDDPKHLCERRDQCPTLDFWAGLYATINAYIDRYTLEDLVRSEEKKNPKHS